MTYDVLAESVALIDSRRLDPVRRLTRRTRFAAMAVDVAGDLAATMFARRGAGCIWQEVHVLALREGKWTYLGGGSATAGDDLLADRPVALSGRLTRGPGGVTSSAPQIMRGNGHGGVLDGGDGTPHEPGSGRWISYGIARVSSRVSSVQVSDRWVPVPWHGQVLVVWSGPERPRLIACDEHSRVVGEALL